MPDEVHRSQNMVHAPVVQLECENPTAEYAAQRKVYLVYHVPLLINPMALCDVDLFVFSRLNRERCAREYGD